MAEATGFLFANDLVGVCKSGCLPTATVFAGTPGGAIASYKQRMGIGIGGAMGLFFYFVLFVVTCLFGLWAKSSSG